jgi:hypothetical protein
MRSGNKHKPTAGMQARNTPSQSAAGGFSARLRPRRGRASKIKEQLTTVQLSTVNLAAEKAALERKTQAARKEREICIRIKDALRAVEEERAQLRARVKGVGPCSKESIPPLSRSSQATGLLDGVLPEPVSGRLYGGSPGLEMPSLSMETDLR